MQNFAAILGLIMVEAPPPETECDIAIVYTPQQICQACGSALFGKKGGPALQIVSIERKAEGLVSTGRILMARCPVCGAAVDEINRAIPIQLNGLTCICGGQQFRFAIRSLKPNKAKKPTEWSFDLDIICVQCDQSKYEEKNLDFSKLKRIRVGDAGVEREVFGDRPLRRASGKR